MFENKGGFSFKSKEEMDGHFAGIEERSKEKTEIVRERFLKKFPEKDEEWEKLLECMKTGIENDAEIEEIETIVKEKFKDLKNSNDSEDPEDPNKEFLLFLEESFLFLYGILSLKIKQLSEEKIRYAVEEDNNK